MEQEQAFRGEMLYTGMLEGALVDPDYSVRVDNVRWSKPGEATILSDQFFLEWLMYREDDIECARPGRNFVTSHAVILVPPGQAVRTRWNSGRLRTISCSFRSELLADYPELLSFLSSLDGDHQFNLDSPFLQAGLTRIADEVVTPGLDSGFMVRSLLFAICGEIRRATLGQPVPQKCDGTLSPGQMTMLRQVLHESGKLPTVVDLAQHCGVTSRALSPLVKRATGVTLRHYIARERLNRAKALLDDQKLMVKQVAYSCGFASAAAFTAAFRKTTGMTPVEYRTRC
ncbi:helix-turn-helix transcriptional regulator [Sphingobium sp. Ant17]|uniref:helix-turn-helix transcriptional regulator n=1 Tax=Sphingobium sp. Ant17 TaxID=1461752 RepID=UPI000445D387|nr:helix-turn-helix transcriptional regulator [Sphingobium sp. Ant17]EXS69058.1 regulatory protein [Sphingobium sp. Ant17]|tara:strand:- start:1760 stop:2617 length:858 start_codon:yes stop_codon:yes gene_type:complete